MLINNKSLIKTINKLNLTDDEREKFNKISEDDKGNFLYNGKPVIGGATEAQAAQIEANKTAIGDENSGLIKEINDIKNASGTFKNIYANNDMPTVFITSDTLTNLKSKADGKANCEFEIRFKNQIIKCFGTGAVQGKRSYLY